MPPQPLNIVVLGGSFAGLSVAHHFLDHIIHRLSVFEGAPTYRLVLVSPSTHLFWNIAAPRALVSPNLTHVEDAFIPIKPAFSRYPFKEFMFVQGLAIAVDTSARKITVQTVQNGHSRRDSRFSSTNSTRMGRESPEISSIRESNIPITADGASIQTIPYHALIIATGSSARSPLFSLHGSHDKTLCELQDFQQRLENSHSIVIVGGGPTGVETAGQLATYYNQRCEWRKSKGADPQPTSTADSQSLSKTHRILFPISKNQRGSDMTAQSAATSPPSLHVTLPAPRTRVRKVITLVSGGDRLLRQLPAAIAKKAERKLKKLGVHIIHNVRELSHTENVDGSTDCILNTDMAINADSYISAKGVFPNTQFLPDHIRDSNGYVITERETLRVYGRDVGERVYAVGDCANYSKNYILDVYDAIPCLMKNLHNDLMAHEYRLQTITSVANLGRFVRNMESSEQHLPKQLQSRPHSELIETPRPASPTLPLSPIPSTYFPRLSIPTSTYAPETPTRRSHSLQPTSSMSPLTSTSPPSAIPFSSLLTTDEARNKIAALEDACYHQKSTASNLVPISRWGGVGVLSDWKVPSFFVYLFKGRSFSIGKADGVVNKGRNPFGI